MHEQDRVSSFVDRHDIDAPPTYRLLDLVSEVGELSKDAAESTNYGAAPDELAISDDEIGDALFALLALAESLDVDAGAALEASLEKYETRLSDSGDPGSGGAA